MALRRLAAVEGIVVGFAQWIVLRSVAPSLRLRSWLLATLTGACVAWLLGVIPSSIATAQERSGTPMPQPSQVAVILMAGAMGMVLGAVLGVPQFLVMRRHFERAGWWIVANAVAWSAGMPLIFVGVSLTVAHAQTVATFAALIGAIATAGAVVGAIEAAWLVRLASRPRGLRVDVQHAEAAA